MTVGILQTVTRQIEQRLDLHPPVHTLPWLSDRDRKRGKWLYDKLWVRNRHGGPWPLPEGATTHKVWTPMGELDAHVLKGTPGKGTVVLAHPDRRYGGHWFVKEGILGDLHQTGMTVVWFDQPGYGQGKNGSPYLAENILNVSAFADSLDDGPTRVIGVSLGSFATAVAAPHMPWVDRIVLESPYRNFASWYEGKDGGLDQVAMRLFGLFFRKHAADLDTQQTLAKAPQDVLVSLTEADVVTPASLSERSVPEGRPVRWHRSQDVEHLRLWSDDPSYAQTVLDFLA